MEKYYHFEESFYKENTSIKLEIKKFNKKGQLCYFDSVDLTCKGLTDEQIELFCKLFSSAGFKVDVKRHVYFGIYDPSRYADIVEIYPTDEQLLKTELLYKANKI